jgi:hypothetical protein
MLAFVSTVLQLTSIRAGLIFALVSTSIALMWTMPCTTKLVVFFGLSFILLGLIWLIYSPYSGGDDSLSLAVTWVALLYLNSLLLGASAMHYTDGKKVSFPVCYNLGETCCHYPRTLLKTEIFSHYSPVQFENPMRQCLA